MKQISVLISRTKALFALPVLVAVLFAFAQGHASAASYLDSHAELPSGGSLVSDSGQFRLTMQTDGNLVAYFDSHAYWASGTSAPGARLAVQGDGNLVIYNGSTPIWASGTSDPSGAQLRIQNDGNVVLVGHSRGLLWASNKAPTRLYSGQKLVGDGSWTIYSPDYRYRMVMQTDGNLVLYDRNTAIWSKHGAQAHSTLEMQSDGNLVLYGGSHNALWATNKFGPDGSYLEGQNDGNFVLYTPSRAVLWSTKGDTTPDVGGAGSNAQLAQQLLNMRSAGKIAIIDYSENKTSDTNDRSLTSLQLQDIAAGKAAHLSMRCSYANQYPTYYPNNATNPDTRILQFLTDLGNQENYGINVLFGQCHTSVTSYHHQGKAVDFDCRWNSNQLTLADNVGAKYGIKRNFETCSANGHWHFSVDGR